MLVEPSPNTTVNLNRQELGDSFKTDDIVPSTSNLIGKKRSSIVDSKRLNKKLKRLHASLMKLQSTAQKLCQSIIQIESELSQLMTNEDGKSFICIK